MNSATEYFAGIYQEIPKPIVVLDRNLQQIYRSEPAELLPELLTDAVLEEAERCLAERKGAVLPVEREMTLYFTPSLYEGEPYLVLMAELPPKYPEMPDLLRVLRNAGSKLSGYLNSIYSVAQQMGLESPEGKVLGEDVRRIMRMADHLDRLIDGEGHLIYRVPMDIGRFVVGFVRSLGEIGLDKTVLTAPYEPDMIAKVMPEDLELVLETLISNAFRFGEGEVIVSVRREEDHIRIIVADNGPGVSQPERLFEWGYRTADRKGVKGLGFSLPMAKRILELQGADLQFERGKGRTCFCIVLDAEPLAAKGKLAEWIAEPKENTLSQVRVELSDYMKEMQL